ncbi:hypothetical protein F4824DRAFT_496806 [Ustulina deusta]|nr:hypothetical protein F4824DRAFT_496806 [Ustulina deusta]
MLPQYSPFPPPLSNTQPARNSRFAWDGSYGQESGQEDGEEGGEEDAQSLAIRTWVSQTNVLSKSLRIPLRNMPHLLSVVCPQESPGLAPLESEFCDARFGHRSPDTCDAISPFEKFKLKDLERKLEGQKSHVASLEKDVRLMEMAYHGVMDETNAWKQLFFGSAENRRITELGFPNFYNEKLVWKNRHIARLEKDLRTVGVRFRRLENAAGFWKQRHIADQKDMQTMELDCLGLMDEIVAWQRRYFLLVGKVGWVVDTLKRFMKRRDSERDNVLNIDESLDQNSASRIAANEQPQYDGDDNFSIYEGLNKALAKLHHYLLLLY